jgi:hypothetical protein
LSIKELDSEIASKRDILYRASQVKTEDPSVVVDALSTLEKLMRKRNKEDQGATAADTIKNLNGSWRLVFTTGTADTQKKIGRVNYFPLKAVQSFDTANGRITNAIYVGNYALLKFFGAFEWKSAPRKIEFDFDEIALFGFKINLGKGGAAKIGQQTGLGSEGNVELAKKGKTPFFNWISADAEIATARGGGGGLALWRRDTETPQE